MSSWPISRTSKRLNEGDDEGAGSPVTRRLLWAQVRNREQADIMTPGFGAPITHYFNHQFINTVGGINNAYSNNPNFAQVPYPWFKFNDRPFATAFEVENVPWAAHHNVFQRFSITSAADDPYTNVDDGFGHLPNLFHASSGDWNAGQR